jgi:site-specific DNA recombinase
MSAIQRRMARLEQGRALAAIPVGMTLRQAWDAADLGWRRTILSLVVARVILYPGYPGRRVWPAGDSPLLERAEALGGPWVFDPSKIDIQWKV